MDKLCKDCKWYDPPYRSPELFLGDFVTKREYCVIVDPREQPEDRVNGGRMKAHKIMMDPHFCRGTMSDMCGPDAKWYEPRETQS